MSLYESPRRNGKSILFQAMQDAMRAAVNETAQAALSNTLHKDPYAVKFEPFELFNTKADQLINALNANTNALNTRNNSRGADGLLAALQAEAANDEPDDELLELGQWVFEGQDDKWIGAAVDKDGSGCLLTCDSLNVLLHSSYWDIPSTANHKVKMLDGRFNAIDWDESFIDRQPINDVDFEDTANEEKETLESEFLGVNPASGAPVDWFGVIKDENDTPELSNDDLQHIFVQNLTTVLVQRMHSLDRFSGEDKVIKFGSLLPWDILYVPTSDPAKRFAVATHPVNGAWFSKLDVLPRTIYESEIEEFRKWAEAFFHYV